MSEFNPIREVPLPHKFTADDTLIVFGEVFDRGYVNGIIDEAEKAGMQIVYSTVGRREKDGTLRPLNAEELKAKAQPLINIPLEAGFDLTPDATGKTPVDQLRDVGLKGWEDVKLDWQSIEQSEERHKEEFRTRVRNYLAELQKTVKLKGSVVFVHTMAGGFPRAKAVMPIANKVFKGTGDRFLSSKFFWETDIGKLCDRNFNTVTADTLKVLIEETAPIRQQVQDSGNKISYVAYGYHGNEVMIDNDFHWHSYSPYLQGWAKIRLETIAKQAFDKNICSTVFNVPEILTNSSSIFLGIEVVIYPLLRALQKAYPQNPQVKKLVEDCNSKLKPPHTFADIDRLSQEYLKHPLTKEWPSFEGWPQHNGPEQMHLMREMSTKIIDLHKDSKDLMTKELSEIVFRACGFVMLRSAYHCKAPVQWIGHDLVTKVFSDIQG